jgi:hypothetical protein
MRFIYNLIMGKAISFTIGEPAGAFAGGIIGGCFGWWSKFNL